MFIFQTSRIHAGKEYTYASIAESYKENGVSKKRILANISHLPPNTISSIKNLLKKGNNTIALEDLEVEQSIDYGNIIIFIEIMKRLKITTLFEKNYPENASLAILMILGKLVTHGSKLGIVHWIKRNPTIAEKLGVSIKTLTEKDCYKVLVDIDNIKGTLEKDWHNMHQKDIQKNSENTNSGTIYLYDITSLYFEGTNNELAMFGYNRDKKAGKKIITVGLITNEYGFPLKIQVFQGNTIDSATVIEQLQTIKQEFRVEHVILVGDRGMHIRYNLEHMNSETTYGSTVENQGIEYISGLTTSEMKTLEENGIIQLTLFDKELVEVSDGNKRYILCVNPKLEAEKQITRAELKVKFEIELLGVQKSYDRKKQQCQKNKQKVFSKKGNNKNENKIESITNAKLKLKLTKEELENWNYRIRKAQEKYHMQKIYTVTITEESMKIEYDPKAYALAGRFDGKYVFETTVSKEVLSKEAVRDTYKQLQTVEHAFRDMKTVQLELRPVFHQKAQTTRGHIFLGMLSYSVLHELERCIFPYLREEQQKREKISLEDIMEELKTIRQVTLSFGKHGHTEVKNTRLTEKQKKILELLHLDAKILTK